MQKYKIITLLNSFSDDEIKDFEDFLNSCYFNTRKMPIQLFKILKNQRGKIDEDNFPKEKFYKRIYGEKKKFNSNTFNDLTSQLLHLAEDFLYIEAAKKDEVAREIYLMQKYSEKGYESLFSGKRKKLIKILDKQEIDSEYFEDIYEMNINEFNYFQIHGTIRKQKDFNSALQEILNLTANLTNYYLLELAGNYINVLVRRNIFENQKIEKDFEKLAKHLFDEKFIGLLEPYNEYQYILEIYKKMLRMFISLDEIYLYHEYKSSIQNHIADFSADERFFHYSKLISYCSLRLIKNYSDIEIRKELTGIAKEIITNKYYLTSRGSYIGIPLYKIFLDNFVFLKDTVSIYFLIKDSIPDMENKYRNNYKNLSLVYYCFLRQDYTEALEHLGKVVLDSFQIIYSVKCLYIKIHYHLKNTEQVLYEIENYLKFLSANKGIPKEKRIREYEFCKATKRIIVAKGKNKYNDIAYLNFLIQKNPNIANKEWLLEITNDYFEKNKKIKIAR